MHGNACRKRGVGSPSVKGPVATRVQGKIEFELRSRNQLFSAGLRKKVSLVKRIEMARRFEKKRVFVTAASVGVGTLPRHVDHAFLKGDDGTAGDHGDTVEHIRRCTCPILVIHSRDDEMIPFSHGQRIFEAVSGEKEVLELSGSHNEGFVAAGQAYRDALDRFLGRVLPSEVALPVRSGNDASKELSQTARDRPGDRT